MDSAVKPQNDPILIGSSKNVIPAKAGIHNMLKFLDSRRSLPS
jgi:hypothetical protein